MGTDANGLKLAMNEAGMGKVSLCQQSDRSYCRVPVDGRGRMAVLRHPVGTETPRDGKQTCFERFQRGVDQVYTRCNLGSIMQILDNQKLRRKHMKHLVTITMMLTMWVASGYAQNVNMSLSGTSAPSTINLGVGLGTSEYTLDGNGVSLRLISASGPSAQPPAGCATGVFGVVLAGLGVFRFADGSLLKAHVTGGSDCVNPPAGAALCIRNLQITGGTGRFKNASGNLTVTMNLAVVVPGNFNMFTDTAKVTGTISGVGGSDEQ